MNICVSNCKQKADISMNIFHNNVLLMKKAAFYQISYLKLPYRCPKFLLQKSKLYKLSIILTLIKHTVATAYLLLCLNCVPWKLLFPDSWKYANVHPIRKKENRQFTYLWQNLGKNSLWLLGKQSGFRPGTIFKLKFNGISGNLLNFFQNYLSNRYQRVVLNGKESDWTSL